jgi:hypothetical protein
MDAAWGIKPDGVLRGKPGHLDLQGLCKVSDATTESSGRVDWNAVHDSVSAKVEELRLTLALNNLRNWDKNCGFLASFRGR